MCPQCALAAVKAASRALKESAEQDVAKYPELSLPEEHRTAARYAERPGKISARAGRLQGFNCCM